MAYEYPYPSAYNAYTAGMGVQGYATTPPMPPRSYTGIYGANSGMPQNIGVPAPQLPTQQTQQSNVPWIQVPNIEAARNVMVQPNQTAYMMNQNAPEFYVKNTDAMGVATLRCFHFSEFDPTQEAAKEVLSSQAGNLVSREEFNNYAQSVNEQFNAIQQALCNTRSLTVPQPAQVQLQSELPITVPLVPTEQTPKKKESAK